MNSNDHPIFCPLEIAPSDPEEASFHVVPVPYEKTVCYGKGTAGGPLAILEASRQLEAYDGVGIPAEAGICTHAPLDCEPDEKVVLNEITAQIYTIAQWRRVPIMLGGEHTITFAAARAFRNRKIPFGIVQFDAHADLRAEFNDSAFSHACVMRRIHEDLEVPVFSIGVRSLSMEEADYRNQCKIGHLDADDLFTNGLPDILLPVDFPQSIYVTIDVDVFDPSVMPATGTPEPGGLGWHMFFGLVQRLLPGRQIIGFDVVELAPVPGLHFPQFTAARMIYNLMGLIVRHQA